VFDGIGFRMSCNGFRVISLKRPESVRVLIFVERSHVGQIISPIR